MINQLWWKFRAFINDKLDKIRFTPLQLKQRQEAKAFYDRNLLPRLFQNYNIANRSLGDKEVFITELQNAPAQS